MHGPWRLLHVINIGALFVGGALLLPAVTRPAELIILVPVAVLLVIYWRFRARPPVVAFYVGIAMALFMWILLCENIVLIDKALGTHLSERLRLSQHLTVRVSKLRVNAQDRKTEPCCNDPLTWHYRPGSRYRAAFDCPACYPSYETTADQTGYLNQPRCPPHCYPNIDMFVAGDSVLQGMGVPSVVEHLRNELPLRLWNLSFQAYGPQQKIDALLTYAVPHRPRWLVLEFYAGNDVAEAVMNDVCRGDELPCRYHAVTLERRLAQHPLYATIFDVRTDVWARLADHATNSFTLALTRYVVDTAKGALTSRDSRSSDHTAAKRFANARSVAPTRESPPSVTEVVIAPWLALGGTSPAPVREGQWPTYMQAGLMLVQRQYERLVTALKEKTDPPRVILLYNPAPYEIYRLIGMEPDPRADEIYPVQREALRRFAEQHGWFFLDLTAPLRDLVQRHQVWLYGNYDQSHLSPAGTVLVAKVLAAELAAILRSSDSAPEIGARIPRPGR